MRNCFPSHSFIPISKANSTSDHYADIFRVSDVAFNSKVMLFINVTIMFVVEFIVFGSIYQDDALLVRYCEVGIMLSCVSS